MKAISEYTANYEKRLSPDSEEKKTRFKQRKETFGDLTAISPRKTQETHGDIMQKLHQRIFNEKMFTKHGFNFEDSPQETPKRIDTPKFANSAKQRDPKE